MGWICPVGGSVKNKLAWAFEDDNGEQQITVAQIPPATSPENAVKAYIVSQYRKGN